MKTMTRIDTTQSCQNCSGRGTIVAIRFSTGPETNAGAPDKTVVLRPCVECNGTGRVKVGP